MGEKTHLENPDCFLLSRSLVLTGSGKALVCAVGKHTRFSLTFPPEELKEEEDFTPL
jgi:hypothetical protein